MYQMSLIRLSISLSLYLECFCIHPNVALGWIQGVKVRRLNKVQTRRIKTFLLPQMPRHIHL